MTRLDLYRFDGSPMNPMFLVSIQPVINPTSTMNPIITPTSKATGKAKRTSPEQDVLGISFNRKRVHSDILMGEGLLDRIDLNMLWWAGVGMIICGGAAYLI